MDAPSKTRELLQAAPKLEAPKGGGAIRGLGETFQANPVTGTSSFTVPLGLSAGRDGSTPALSLSYDSGSGNGLFGVGWSVSIPSIQRKTDKGLPHYDDTDVFVLSGAEDLVPVGAPQTRGAYTVQTYLPRVEAAFARIERWTHTTTYAVHWESWSADNVHRRYGTTTGSLLRNPAVPRQIFAWHLVEETDERGNRIVYEYDDVSRDTMPATATETRRNPAYVYPTRALWGNLPATTDRFLFELVFDYGDIDAATHTRVATCPARQDPFSRFRARFDQRCGRLCRRLLVYHRFDTGQDADATLIRATELSYTESPALSLLTAVVQRGYNADGSSLALPSLTLGYAQASAPGAPTFLTGLEDLPNGIDFSRAQWVDLDGEGLTGLLVEEGGAWWYKRNEGDGRLARARRIPVRPTTSTQLMDVDGDGRLEVVQREGFFARADDDWLPMQRFHTVAPEMPDSITIDADGDGLPDRLVALAQSLVVYRNKGRTGWDDPIEALRPTDEDRGPTLLFRTATESILLADMTGDGLTDLVRVRTGNVQYWPNLGYGRFGPKIQMTGAPRITDFDPRRVRLADTDGTGPADLVYVGPDGVWTWSNQSGNGYGSPTRIPGIWGVEDAITVSVTDLLGTGTAAVVWTSPLRRDGFAPIRCVPLHPDGKPYVLTSVDNGLGRVTTLSYTPSTAFYLADRRAGTPWATRLPFPVQCLSKVEVQDAVTGWSGTTTSTYHHGYYDGVEREFRGFARVETRDAEVIQNVDDPLPLTPSITKTWFHTGAPGDLGQRLVAEWTAIAVDPGACTISNVERDAYRALKGKPLRVEIFADDGNPLPYLVTASTHAVVKRADRVYRVDAAQTVAVHTERGTDARTEHTLVLDVDVFGNVKLQAKVAYGRSAGDTEQTTPVIVLTQTDFASFDPTKGWHPHTPWRTRTWELGIAVSGTVTASALKSAFDAATVRDFDESLSTGQKRLLSDKVVVYANDAGTAALAEGSVDARALVHTTWVRAFTAAQATTLGVTMTDGGYVQRSDGAWWVPSGTPSWDPDRFWVVTAITNPFGEITDIAWDTSGRFTTGVVDPVGNSVAATWDPRSLNPLTITDPNGTTTTVSYDALGRVVDVWISDGTDGDTTSPSSSFTYSFIVPASARAKARANHGDADFTHETVSYSDGGGAVVQQKVKVSATEWVGTGRTVHDQKGNPVKQYEPFITTVDTWEPEAGFDGVTVLITYDPLGRAVRVDNPDGTFRTVTFDPWTQTTADECDNDSSSPHAGTPTTVHLDAQGRPYRTDEVLDGSTTFTTRLTLDTVGNALVVTDANGLATQTQAFDLLGRPWSSRSPDTNDPTDPDDVDLVFLDLTGQPLKVSRSGGLVVETAYDVLRRKTTISADGVVRERFVYGEGTAKAAGRILEIWDRAGRVVYAYDFKGNIIDERRRFATDPAAVLDWTTTSTTGLGSDYTTTRSFDAQNRPKTQTTPDNSTTNLGYDVAGRLTTVSANLRGSSTATSFVTAISYNARGQRAGITYQNGVVSTLNYDPLTFRLTQILSMNGTTKVQDLNYSYDPVGNITQIEDKSFDREWCNNTEIGPIRAYTYDALYRLVSATGREKNPSAVPDWTEPTYGPFTAANVIDVYTEDFVYDPVGNLLSVAHDGIVDWTRAYTYATGTNRLATTTVGSNTVSYSHNTRGAMTAMPHLAAIDVDDRDQMVRAQLSATEDWLYVYDSAGQRVRKVRRTGSTIDHDRIYVGSFETWTDGTDVVETLHLMDGQRRIALFDAKTTSTGTTTTTRYQLDDHLGSAAWELDDAGNVLSYEEFHPYGTTAWWVHSTSVSLKRYRFTGMERDEDTGLQCHGVRYYAPWLGRWASADPIGLGDGVNRFRYCHNRPTGGYDPGGTADFGWYDRLSTAAYATYDAAVDKATSASDTLVAVKSTVTNAVAHPIDTAVAVYNVSPHKKVVEGDYAGAVKQMASMYVENAKTGAQTAGTVVGNSSGVLPATNLYFLTTGDKAEVKVAAEANVDQLATTASVTASVVAPEMAAGALARVAPLIRGTGVAPKVAAPVVEELAAVAEAAPVASRGLAGFSASESAIIREAQGIVGSSEFGAIRSAHAAGESVTVNIGGRLIQYEPGLPASGMTMFGENGFVIGREAFASSGELNSTVLHELYRLSNTGSAAGVSAELAAQETQAAFDFAQRASSAMGP